jgi:hypothetical protein
MNKTNTFVAAIYDSHWYVGKITEFDDYDQEYHISFMAGARKSLRWFEKGDKLWITERDILCSLDDSVKMSNMFTFSAKDSGKMKDLFQEIG